MNKPATIMGASAISTSIYEQIDKQLGLCLSNKDYRISSHLASNKPYIVN